MHAVLATQHMQAAARRLIRLSQALLATAGDHAFIHALYYNVSRGQLGPTDSCIVLCLPCSVLDVTTNT